MEMLTYRYRGHSMSDPAKYRSKEEVQKVRQERDPIERLCGIMTERDVMDEARLKEIDKEVKAIVSEAADFAQSSTEPDVSELYTDAHVDDRTTSRGTPAGDGWPARAADRTTGGQAHKR